MPYPLYADLTEKVRASLDDRAIKGGSVYTDDFLQAHFDMALKKMVSAMVSNGVRRMIFRQDGITVPALTTVIYRADDPNLPGGSPVIFPTNFIQVDQLWEAKIGGVNSDYVPMSGPGEIPRIDQTDMLRYWDLYGGQLQLLGSTVDRLLRVDYWGDVGALNPAGVVPIIVSDNFLVALVCHQAALSKGNHQAAQTFAVFDQSLPYGLGGIAGYELANMVNEEIKTQQSEPMRRRPYFGKNRYSTSDNWFRGR